MDFNGLVRHYYLRQSRTMAEIRINWSARSTAGCRATRSACGCARPATQIAEQHHARMKIVETAARPAGARHASWPRSTASPTIATRT